MSGKPFLQSEQTAGMRIITATVHPDEACYGLEEYVQMVLVKGVKQPQPHRIQRLFVVRDDSIAAYEEDLGPASQFVGAAIFRILGPFGEDTVGEMRDEAERSRYDTYESKLREEVRQSSTLIEDFLQEREENLERIHNRTVIGPAIKKQRDDFPHELRERRI